MGVVWLVGCFGFNGLLRQYFSLYRAVSQREGERGSFLLSSILSLLSPSLWETARYRLKYCLKGPLNPKQPTNPGVPANADHEDQNHALVPNQPTQCLGVLLIWIIVGQGPIVLAVGAGGGCLDIFSLIYHFFCLSPSLWETARYRLKYCLKGMLNPEQPTNQIANDLISMVIANDCSLFNHVDAAYSHLHGCKIPLRLHWRVNIDGGRVKLAMRSPDRASEFLSSEFEVKPDFSEVYSGSGDHFLVCKYYP